MTVEVKEIVKQNAIESAEDDMPHKLSSSGIHSEIDFLKRIKLRAQVLSSQQGLDPAHKLSPEDIVAVSFESKEDKRKKSYYSKLITIYNDSVKKPADVAAGYTQGEKDAKLQAKMKLSYLYSIYGMKDLYELACDLSNVERVQESNEEIKGLSTTIFK